MGCVTWLQVCKSPADKLMTSTGNSECKYLSQRWKFDQIIKYIAERIISPISSRSSFVSAKYEKNLVPYVCNSSIYQDVVLLTKIHQYVNSWFNFV